MDEIFLCAEPQAMAFKGYTKGKVTWNSWEGVQKPREHGYVTLHDMRRARI